MRILAIGDIHGCLTALNALLEFVAPRPDDLLITLGDYTDRGPDSRGVLDRLVALHATGRLVALRGNHDFMMTQARAGHDLSMWLSCGGKETMAAYGVRIRGKLFGLDAIPEAHWKFLEEDLVDTYETDHHIFAHGAIEPDLPMSDQPTYILHWEKVYGPIRHCSGKVLVCGHTKQHAGVPTDFETTICIDTGAYDPKGWLTCLDVRSGKYWQANQAGERRTSVLGHSDEAEA